jgi:hypothetical protein
MPHINQQTPKLTIAGLLCRNSRAGNPYPFEYQARILGG